MRICRRAPVPQKHTEPINPDRYHIVSEQLSSLVVKAFYINEFIKMIKTQQNVAAVGGHREWLCVLWKGLLVVWNQQRIIIQLWSQSSRQNKRLALWVSVNCRSVTSVHFRSHEHFWSDRHHITYLNWVPHPDEEGDVRVHNPLRHIQKHKVRFGIRRRCTKV